MITWVALFGGLAFGAGFDCSKAAHPVETRICSDPILSKLDDSLALAWKSTLKVFDSNAQLALRREQKEWMSEIRREASQLPELRRTWRHRLRELELKRTTQDLRSMVGAIPTTGKVRLENTGTCGRMDLETGEPVVWPAVDILELSVSPDKGGLQFSLTSGVDQAQCHSCEVEAVVPAARSPRRPWSSGSGEERAWGTLEIFPDRIVVEVLGSSPSFHCGIGASLGGAYIFRRHGLRLGAAAGDP